MPWCLPDKLFGNDTDEIFAYTTEKKVWIRDRWLGFAFYNLLFLITCWVAVGQILWRNEHFQLKDVRGLSRIWFQHPTLHGCDAHDGNCLDNWRSLEVLPYCEETKMEKVLHAAPCIYGDKHTTFGNQPSGSDDRLFIPTSLTRFTERRECNPSSGNGHRCDFGEYRKVTHDGDQYLGAKMTRFFADIEGFEIQLTSSYHRDEIMGSSLEHQAYIADCHFQRKPGGPAIYGWADRMQGSHRQCQQTREKIPCKHGMNCNIQEQPLPDVVSRVLKDPKSHNSQAFHEEDALAARVLLQEQVRLRGSNNLTGLLEEEYHPHRHITRMLNAHQEAGTRAAAPSAAAPASAVPPEGAPAAAEPSSSPPAPAPASDQAHPTMYSTPWGERFQVGELLRLAGVDLDRDFNMDGFSARQAGTIIEIESKYNNLYHWVSSFGYTPVEYTYEVNERPVPYVSREFYSVMQPDDYPETRSYDVQHGILIVFKVSGTFGFFNVVYLLLMLSVSAAMLGAANKIMDVVAIYAHPRRRNYFHLKYEVSPDFSDTWRCTTCGYYNEHHQEFCQGVERWKSARDDGVCNAPRPAGV